MVSGPPPVGHEVVALEVVGMAVVVRERRMKPGRRKDTLGLSRHHSLLVT